jgi:hypothetical protein
LTEEVIDEGGFAVIDVGDNAKIAELSHAEHPRRGAAIKQAKSFKTCKLPTSMDKQQGLMQTREREKVFLRGFMRAAEFLCEFDWRSGPSVGTSAQ